VTYSVDKTLPRVLLGERGQRLKAGESKDKTPKIILLGKRRAQPSRREGRKPTDLPARRQCSYEALECRRRSVAPVRSHSDAGILHRHLDAGLSHSSTARSGQERATIVVADQPKIQLWWKRKEPCYYAVQEVRTLAVSLRQDLQRGRWLVQPRDRGSLVGFHPQWAGKPNGQPRRIRIIKLRYLDGRQVILVAPQSMLESYASEHLIEEAVRLGTPLPKGRCQLSRQVAQGQRQPIVRPWTSRLFNRPEWCGAPGVFIAATEDTP